LTRKVVDPQSLAGRSRDTFGHGWILEGGEGVSDRREVTQRWGIPGRVRFDVAALLAEPLLAGDLERIALARPGVERARANPMSGSLLVVYDPVTLPPEAVGVLADDLAVWLHDRSVPPPGPPRASALVRVLSLGDDGPEHVLWPALLSGGGYALSTLQWLSIGSIVSAALGETPWMLRVLGRGGRVAPVLRLAAAGAVISAAATWVNYQRRKAWRRYARSLQKRLRDEVFEALESQDMAFFDRHGTGEVLAWIVDDVDRVGALVEEGDAIIDSVLTVVSAAVTLVAAAPSLAFIATCGLVLFMLPVRSFKPKVEAALGDEFAARGRLQESLENAVAGIVEVKSFTAEALEANRVGRLNDDITEASVRSGSSAQMQSLVAGMSFFDFYILAITYGARRVLSGKMSGEELNQANYWYPRLISSVGRVSESIRVYYAAQASAQRLTAVLDSKPEVANGPGRLPRPVRGEIALQDVSFGYSASKEVLHHVSFTIPAGATVGIVGPTGSGKSTVLRLLLRLYDPTAGEIRLDGEDLRRVALRDVRSNIALVAQDPYLFNDTVANNVRFGRPDATDGEVVAALSRAGAEELVEALPEGLETVVGERGQRLSGGQRQRVAIARALLKAAPIVALDEPTAHLDYRTETEVLRSLRDVTAGATVILVAHRLTNVRNADRIIVLDGGRVREEGDHQSLIDAHGLYFEMWQLQN
jgi:ATP-binding cassette, subfamily B, bacterial